MRSNLCEKNLHLDSGTSEGDGEAVTKFLILYLVTSLLGWVWVIMGISTLRRCRETRERERSRTTAKVLCMIPEKKQRWNSHRHRHETRTVWHPVVEFTVDGRKYHLQSPSNLIHSDLSVGEDVDIIYDADEPAHFDFEKVLEHDIRAAKIFIVVGLVWALFFTPFLVNKTLNE